MSEIERLRFLLARLQRLQFGQKSEKVQRQIEQLELRLDELKRMRVRAASGRKKRFQRQPFWGRVNQYGDPCPNICRARSKHTSPRVRLVRIAVALCVR